MSRTDGNGTVSCQIPVLSRKPNWPTAKLRLAAASSSQGSGRAGRWTRTPATMATTLVSVKSPQVNTRPPGARKYATASSVIQAT